MAFLYKEWRIPASIIFALVAIRGAYWLAVDATHPAPAQASTETALLTQIANKDSNGDGLPDWEKSLYGIPVDATTTDYFHLGMTDGEAVAKGLIVPVAATPNATSTPVVETNVDVTSDLAADGITSMPSEGSLTDTFAKNFFSLYVSAEQNAGGSLTDDQINTVADQALTELSGSVTPAPDFKTAVDIQTSGSGPAALTTYAANAENVLRAYGVSLPESELGYLQDYLNDNDPAALANLTTIANEYRQIAIGLAALPVPIEAKAADLEVINATARMGEIISDFANVSNDPLTAMLSLQEYPQAAQALLQAYIDMATAYANAGVTIPRGTPGWQFVGAAAYIESPTSPTP